jgi:hypothetical protein
MSTVTVHTREMARFSSMTHRMFGCKNIRECLIVHKLWVVQLKCVVALLLFVFVDSPFTVLWDWRLFDSNVAKKEVINKELRKLKTGPIFHLLFGQLIVVFTPYFFTQKNCQKFTTPDKEND